MQHDFEWDPAKARSNLRDHKVSFEPASQIFLTPTMSLSRTKNIAQMNTAGLLWVWTRGGVLLVICHTFREVDPLTATSD